MILEKVIADSGVTAVEGSVDIDITSVCNDSRKAAQGSLFVAVKGFASDGHNFIATAVKNGACVVVCEDIDMAHRQIAEAGAEDITIVSVKSSRYALAIIASNFYDNPSEKLTLVGITGTNGKTTTVTLLYRMFTSLGYSCGLLSTIANYVGNRGYEAVNTTSDPLTINSLLNEMVEAGCGNCFM